MSKSAVYYIFLNRSLQDSILVLVSIISSVSRLRDASNEWEASSSGVVTNVDGQTAEDVA